MGESEGEREEGWTAGEVKARDLGFHMRTSLSGAQRL